MSLKQKSLWISLILTVLTIVLYYGYSFLTFSAQVQSPAIVPTDSPNSGTPTEKPEIPIWGGTERVNILFMGVDRRELRPNEMPRSDSMMLVSIDPITQTYTHFSILRDTYVEIPGFGESRINAALGQGGPELAMETVSQFTGLSVSYYVITDFEGFKGLIDAVGGVEIFVEKNMRYRDPTDKGKYDINLKKGLQKLDGDKALQYVRFRHDALSDYTRTERQRKLLTALSQQLKSGMTVLQLPSILQATQPYIQTNLNTTDMLKLAALGLSLEGTAADGYQLPQAGAFHDSNRGGSVLIPSIEDVQKYVQEVLSNSMKNKANM